MRDENPGPPSEGGRLGRFPRGPRRRDGPSQTDGQTLTAETETRRDTSHHCAVEQWGTTIADPCRNPSRPTSHRFGVLESHGSVELTRRSSCSGRTPNGMRGPDPHHSPLSLPPLTVLGSEYLLRQRFQVVGNPKYRSESIPILLSAVCEDKWYPL